MKKLADFVGIMKELHYVHDLPDNQRGPGSKELKEIDFNLRRMLVALRFGDARFANGDRNLELDNCIKALSLILELGNERAKGSCYNNMANCLRALEDKTFLERKAVEVPSWMWRVPEEVVVVTISTASDLELTIATADESAELKVTSGSFDGCWKMLAQGVPQFCDRAYTLSGIPASLLGHKYFLGPCHSGNMSLEVISTSDIVVLVGCGNSEKGLQSLDISPKPEKLEIESMATTSLKELGFHAFTVKRPSIAHEVHRNDESVPIAFAGRPDSPDATATCGKISHTRVHPSQEDAPTTDLESDAENQISSAASINSQTEAVAGPADVSSTLGFLSPTEIPTKTQDEEKERAEAVAAAEVEFLRKFDQPNASSTFTGSEVLVAESSALPINETPYTIEMWLMPKHGHERTVPLYWGALGNGSDGFRGGVCLQLRDGSCLVHHILGGVSCVAKCKYQEEKWIHVAVTRDKQEIAVYVNGALKNKRSGSDCQESCPTLFISCAKWDKKAAYRGRIADIRVWDRVLSAHEFNNTLDSTSPPDSLVRWYCFGDDISAETGVIRDLSRHNADARVLNVEQRMQEEFQSGLAEKHPMLHPLVLPLLAGLEARDRSEISADALFHLAIMEAEEGSSSKAMRIFNRALYLMSKQDEHSLAQGIAFLQQAGDGCADVQILMSMAWTAVKEIQANLFLPRYAPVLQQLHTMCQRAGALLADAGGGTGLRPELFTAAGHMCAVGCYLNIHGNTPASAACAYWALQHLPRMSQELLIFFVYSIKVSAARQGPHGDTGACGGVRNIIDEIDQILKSKHIKNKHGGAVPKCSQTELEIDVWQYLEYLYEAGSEGSGAKDVIFCIDISGSMGFKTNTGNTRLFECQAALRQLLAANILKIRDRFGLKVFDDKTDTLMELTGNSPASLKLLNKKIDQMKPRGETMFYTAIKTCVSELGKASDGQTGNDQWVVALTDGETLDGDGDVYKGILERLARKDSSSLNLIFIIVGANKQGHLIDALEDACHAKNQVIHLKVGTDDISAAFKQVGDIMSAGGGLSEDL